MNNQDSNRQNGERAEEEFELTAAEKKALEELRRDRAPSDLLEERVVGALHERGLLVRPGRRIIEITAWRSIAAAAACLVLLATGFVLGQWAGSRESPGNEPAGPVNDDFSVAAAVQQTGSAYLQALQQVADVPDDIAGEQAMQGREVALAILCTAADRVSRLVPKDVLTGQLLVSLDNEAGAREGGEYVEITINRDQIIEF